MRRWTRIERLGPFPGGETGEALGLAAAEGERPEPVVLRPVPEDLWRDPARRGQLEWDLVRAGRLLHPNLAPPLGLGPPEGPGDRLERLVPGETLAAVIARGGRLPPAMAARVVADACAGVHFAHEGGRDPALVHGHLRPEALLLCYSGATLVAGLGAGSVEAARPLRERLPWVSPEQILVGPSAADRQTDVYLLGLLLHACLTGEAPFGGEADAERAALSAAPAPLAAMGVPAALAEVVERAAAKSSSDRFPGAAALGRAVELAVGELAPPGALAAYLDVLFPPGEGPRAERLAMVEKALSRERPAESAAAPAPPPRPPPRPVDLVSTADILPEPAVPPLPRAPPDLVTTGDIVGDGSAPFMVARPPPAPLEPPRRDRGTAILSAGIAVAGLAIGYGLAQRVEAPAPPPAAPSTPAAAPGPVAAPFPAAATASPARPATAVPAAKPATAAPAAKPATAASPAPAPPIGSPPPAQKARPEPRREASASGPPSIEVTADPPGDVYVDGKRVGRAPLSRTVSRGRHKVRLHDKASGLDVTKRVDVKGPGTPVRFAVGKGALTVTAPEGAAILLDGRKVGTGRVEALPVYAGPHRLTVQLGPARNEHDFRIAAGETYSYDVQRTGP